MSLVEHAEQELRSAGLCDKDSDYEGMVGEAVLDLVKTFADQGHSGYSAHMTLDIFSRVAAYKPLGPLTSNPDEWMHIADDVAGNKTTWQSRRRPDAFSEDSGKTYYLLDEDQGWLRRQLNRRRMHKAVVPNAD